MTGKDRLLNTALEAFKKAGYEGIGLLPTGSGKARLMIEIAKILNPATILYLCDGIRLRDKDFKAEMVKWGAAHLIPRTTFHCYKGAYTKVGEKYDLLLADEFDFGLTPKYRKVFDNNTFGKRIFMSATLDDAKRKLIKRLAPVVFERTPKEIIDQGVVNGVRFWFVNYNLSYQENGYYLMYNSEFKKLLNEVRTKEVEIKLNWLKIQRKQFLSRLQSSLEVTKWLLTNLRQNKPNEKVLIFCGLSEQADKVCKHAYHSNNNEDQFLQAFDAGEILQLAVVDKVNRGLNINAIRHIIMECTGSSKTRLTQRLGRGARLAVDDVLNVYILIPWFMSLRGERKPTIVNQWVIDTTADMDLSKCKTIWYNK